MHCFAADGSYARDETFSCLVVDGIRLNEKHIQYFMAQWALPYLEVPSRRWLELRVA